MLAPEAPITQETTVTLGVVMTVVGAVLTTLFSMFCYVRVILGDYIKRDVYDEREAARTERWNAMKETLEEMRDDIKAIRRGDVS